MRRALAIVLAALAAAALVAVHLSSGGGDFEPATVANPCTREVRVPGRGLEAAAERVAFVALDSAACELRVSREKLLLAVAGEGGLDVDRDRRDEAFRNGLRKAVDEEEQAGRLGSTEAALFRAGIELAPVGALLDQLFAR